MRKTHAFIKTTISEPFPVFYSPNCSDKSGPFYAAGAEFFELDRGNTLAAKERAAEALRLDGYTVKVERVQS